MCGIAAILGNTDFDGNIGNLLASQTHRGPDSNGYYTSECKRAILMHNRLSIIDLSADGKQPMSDPTGRYTIAFNGEIYNYLEIKKELAGKWDFKSATDTEVLLAGFAIYGKAVLDKLVGMFAFVIWDDHKKQAFVARDRFGVKPVYYHTGPGNRLLLSSEIKLLHQAGVPKTPNNETWSSYLSYGLYDTSENTFWKNVKKLLPGHCMEWTEDSFKVSEWYNLAKIIPTGFDKRSHEEVMEEYYGLLLDSIGLRFRADVPVGINLSGGLDSSTLLGLVQKHFGKDSDVKAFTFTTGDENYDELPWVNELVENTKHPLIVSQLNAEEVPDLAAKVQYHQDEPFGGLPTIAYAKLFRTARENGVVVLLDGQGMDEQWAGYDYYQKIDQNNVSTVQGTRESPVRPDCLKEDFMHIGSKTSFPKPFDDDLRNIQYRDSFFTKIPRALRFNDRVSMQSSTELREPFLDHRLFELAFQQPADRKIKNGQGKVLLRSLVEQLLPTRIAQAPKRPLQTPQREWLRGPLKVWAEQLIEKACNDCSDWLVYDNVQKEWNGFLKMRSDNSFYVWQWISIGLMDLKNG